MNRGVLPLKQNRFQIAKSIADRNFLNAIWECLQTLELGLSRRYVINVQGIKVLSKSYCSKLREKRVHDIVLISFENLKFAGFTFYTYPSNINMYTNKLHLISIGFMFWNCLMSFICNRIERLLMLMIYLEFFLELQLLLCFLVLRYETFCYRFSSFISL